MKETLGALGCSQLVHVFKKRLILKRQLCRGLFEQMNNLRTVTGLVSTSSQARYRSCRPKRACELANTLRLERKRKLFLSFFSRKGTF